MKQILEGLRYIHETKDIMHRDIKPGNILLQKNRRSLTHKISIDNLDDDSEEDKEFNIVKYNDSRLTGSTHDTHKESFDYQVKICDFGLAKKDKEGIYEYNTEAGGTRMFQSPEQALGQGYGKPVDIWATGIVMFYLLTFGKHPVTSMLEDTNNDGVDYYMKKISKLKKKDLNFKLLEEHYWEKAANLFGKL